MTETNKDRRWSMRAAARLISAVAISISAFAAMPSFASIPGSSNAILPICIPEAGFFEFRNIEIPNPKIKSAGSYDGVAHIPPLIPAMIHRCKVGSYDIEIWARRLERPQKGLGKVCYSGQRDWVKIIVNGDPFLFTNVVGDGPPYEYQSRDDQNGWYRISGCPRVDLKLVYLLTAWGGEALGSCVRSKETNSTERCHIEPLEARK